MSTNKDSKIIPVGEELPPLDALPTKPTNEVRSDARPPKTASGRKGKRTLMRFREINTFCDETLRVLQRAEAAVWLLLWRDTRPDGRARVGQADLARRAGCTERTVRRALVVLESRGLVKTLYQGGWPKRVSVYQVTAVPKAGGPR
jgi:hypothetical protein